MVWTALECPHQGTGEHESRKGHPLFQDDPRHGVERTRERLWRHGFLSVTAPLDRKGNSREHHGTERQEPPPLNQPNAKRNVADEEQRHENDVQEKIQARLVIARISRALRPKER